MLKILSAAEFRGNAAKTLDSVFLKGERVLLGRRGKPMAALVPLGDLELMKDALQAEEDRRDAAEAVQVLKRIETGEEKTIPWEEAERQLDAPKHRRRKSAHAL